MQDQLFENKEDLLGFLLRCRQAGIKRLKLDEIEVEFSDISLALDAQTTLEAPKTEEKSTSKTLVDTQPDEADEDLLFWSAKS